MSGMDGALRLVELTSTRLCHDISGLIGSLDRALAAPSSGATVDHTSGRPASGATQTMTTRLQLRRAAWGPDGDPLSMAQIEHLSAGLPDNIAVDLSAMPHAATFAAPAGRIVLNLLLLAADSLPSGGIVVLAGAPDDLFVRIVGPAAGWPAGMALCLANEADAQSALTDGRSLQMALTVLLARAAGIRLSAAIPSTTRSDPPILRLGG